MVLAERNTESIRNGRRGPSPNGNNGNCSPTSSSDEENCKFFSFKIMNIFSNNLNKKTKISNKKNKKITASKKIGSKSSKTKSSEYEGETHFSLL